MFWVDRVVEEILEEKSKKIKAKQSLVVRDEKTMSGRVHAGSLRGVAVHGIVSEGLREKGVLNEYLFEINDFDVFDTVPHYLDQKKFSLSW
jgi:lysyl-tRNA synthetase, class I